jgi:hypothetical protein
MDNTNRLQENQLPLPKYKVSRLTGERKRQEEKYRMERANVLRELYENNPVKEKRVLTYKHPTNGQKNLYELDAIEPNPYSPFDNLELLEEKMPNKNDFF